MSGMLLLREENGVCPMCKTKFKKKRPHQKFDSSKCRKQYWEALHPRVSLLERVLNQQRSLSKDHLDPS